MTITRKSAPAQIVNAIVINVSSRTAQRVIRGRSFGLMSCGFDMSPAAVLRKWQAAGWQLTQDGEPVRTDDTLVIPVRAL